MSDIVVGPGAVVPDEFIHGVRCSVGPYVFVGPDCTLGDDVRIEPRATVLAPEPSSGGAVGRLVIESGVTIGASAVHYGFC